MKANLSTERLKHLKKAKRIVLKLGTKVILSHNNDIEKKRVNKLIEDIAHFSAKGYTFVIVSSGAVGLGMAELGLQRRPKDLKNIQALASIGQNILMQKWYNIFKEYNIKIGQILLTYDVIADRKRFLYARDCFNTMEAYGVIPIVNENDSVSIDELKFGDNDTLSSLTSLMIDADLLVLFTDTNGLFNKNPQKYKYAERISYVKNIDADLFSLVEDKKNDFSLGGMTSKLKAAKLCADGGTPVVITDGFNPNLKEILEGEDVGTFIAPKNKEISSKKKWIFFNNKIKGEITIDSGAEEALLHRRKSLLPGGIVKVEGKFGESYLVGIYNIKGNLIAKGIVYHSSEIINKIKGKKTKELNTILEKPYYEEIIDRNNMIII